MFFTDGFLFAVVDYSLESNVCNFTTSSPTDNDDKNGNAVSFNTLDDVSHHDAAINDNNLSNRQRQKLKRKLKKQQAIQLSRRQKACNIDVDNAQSCPSPSRQSLRLHQFVSTCFRSELNISENGVGCFINNAAKVSAHHAILNGLVRVNGIVTTVGSKTMECGDLVSLEIDTSSLSASTTGKLISWTGSEDVANKVEDQRDYGERKGRMTTSLASSSYPADVDSNSISSLPFIQYYRTKLGRLWVPSIHEVAIMKPLPITLRVLKNSKRLEDELRGFGFRPVKESDVSFQLCPEEDGDATQQQQRKPIDPSIMKEFMSNTWIIDQGQLSTAGKESQLGVFLSEARISGEILQQELNSMMPVSILISILKKKMAKEQNCDSSFMSSTRPMRFLDLCAAPGSKTCQLITALDTVLVEDRDQEQKRCNDFVIVANELNPSRAIQLRQRCFQQCGSRSLSHLLITNADGRDFENVEEGSFDFIICDVPCSGDGTIRRSPDLLHKWSTKNAEKNKPVQQGLLKVALKRLRHGGICVYSTCSLNPIENDEVVEETLNELNSISTNEYSLLNLEGSSEGSCDSLRILPAASHGGFFVAAIRRKESEIGEKAKIEVNHDEYSVELVWKNKQSNQASVAYATSPCTRNLSAHISERLGPPISCGVPVMYKAKDENSPVILQEGCAALNALHDGLVSVVQLSKLQLGECAGHVDGRTRCIPKKLFTHINKKTTALIIRVNADNVILLPAKMIHKQKLDGTKNIDDGVSYEVEIIARPQILKRLICGN
mmetsp:Transcript_20459/g.40810  ORF Transcript_20459/g.40810 Transcript_20459/m.40810 type:complete len:778 (+) Transcript_20459:76-2409(+)